ncbi:MAG TPA: hypothetical protein VHY20_01835 [Pirellulales bacterium]|nr:hypothetical protein [Pirellulales bacterium]
MKRFHSMLWLVAASLLTASSAPIIAAAAPMDDRGPAAAQTQVATAAQTQADKAALAPLQSYVGAWRGVGQVERGSNRGAWIEQADWAWKFADGHAAIVFSAPEGKHYVAGRIVPLPETGKLQLHATRADKKTIDRFTGEKIDDRWVFKADQFAADSPARMTLRQVAGGDRLIILLESRPADGDQYRRLAEIGYTRQGSDFGKGTTYRECVVTGGLGTIAVEHEGQTYYVCCTGCRDLFNENPAAILAEYRQRKAQGK